MPGQNIGLKLPNGWAGNCARQPDLLIDTHPLGGTRSAPFGAPLCYGTGVDAGRVVPMGAGAGADTFVGVAVSAVKSAVNYAEQSTGGYAPGEAVGVLKRGCVNVHCAVGLPALGGTVYLRVAENSAVPTGVVGGFEAQPDGSNTVTLTNCRWAGSGDGQRVAEMRILGCMNA